MADLLENRLSTQPQEQPARPPALSPVELLRWAWRQLTSMRTALLLLFLLALAAVPGSLFPQRGVDPVAVGDFFAAHPSLAPFLDRLSAFDVYAAPWFAAIYLLLFASLAGCVIPRSRRHWAAMRAAPPAAPRHLDRLPLSASWLAAADPDDPDDARARAAAVLRSRRFRVVVDGPTVRAEKGYLRETGNLIFHLALLVLLGAVAAGGLWGYRGNRLVVEGDGFANTLTQYDDFTGGRLFAAADLAPFVLTLADFTASYQEDGDQRGAPRTFHAYVDVRRDPDAAPERRDVRVNHPLGQDGTKAFLVGHGYAPKVTVRDRTGEVVFAGAVPFLPQDGMFTSIGVIKVPDTGQDQPQLGFSGFFLPSATLDPVRGPVSAFPAPRNPALFLTVYSGDLGLDDGRPESVFRLDMDGLEQLRDGDQPLAFALKPGERRELPDGLGSITFDGFTEWANFQVARDPGKGPALASAAAALAGLMLSLGVRRRRVWVRVADAAGGPAGRAVVQVGGLGRSESGAFREEFDRLAADLRAATAGEKTAGEKTAGEANGR
jgi:cytochrome c biogenesis protein